MLGDPHVSHGEAAVGRDVHPAESVVPSVYASIFRREIAETTSGPHECFRVEHIGVGVAGCLVRVSNQDRVMRSEECTSGRVDRREDRAAKLVAVEDWQLAQHDRPLVADHLDAKLLGLDQFVDANVREVVDLRCSVPNKMVPAFFVIA